MQGMMADSEKYRPITKLGQGGMSSVVLTVTSGPGDVRKLLVIKLLPGLAGNAEFVSMFMNEARMVGRSLEPSQRVVDVRGRLVI